MLSPTNRPSLGNLLLLIGSALLVVGCVGSSNDDPATDGPLPAISTEPAAEPPPSPVRAIRFKLSAGDLLSAESILEVHRQQHGEGSEWINGMAWLARGAAMLGDYEKARFYAQETRRLRNEARERGEDVINDRSLEVALGAAIEVEAQCLVAEDGNPRAAIAFLEQELSKIDGRTGLRSRIQKRINLYSLSGTAAPELEIEDWIGDEPPSLASLLGQPIVIFFWAEWCGDCKSQAALLARARERYEEQGARFVTVTRYYDEPADQATEKARVESVWNESYNAVGELPILFSTASMVRYGVSATPTFVFIDRAGTVRSYLPVRLTETEFDRRIEEVLAE